jgi:hypothetical protein
MFTCVRTTAVKLWNIQVRKCMHSIIILVPEKQHRKCTEHRMRGSFYLQILFQIFFSRTQIKELGPRQGQGCI